MENKIREFTHIDNKQSDDIVACFSYHHPFFGSAILKGHLESLGIHLPRQRVQESLKRVDVLNILTWYVNCIVFIFVHN